MAVLYPVSRVFHGSHEVSLIYKEDDLKWPHVPWSPREVNGLAVWIDPKNDLYSEGEQVLTYREHSGVSRILVPHDKGYPPIFHTGTTPHIEYPSFGLPGGSGAPGGNEVDGWNAGPNGLTFIMLNRLHDLTNTPMMITHHTAADGFEMRHGTSSMQIVQRGVSNSHGTAEAVSGPTLHILRVDVPNARAEAWVGDVKATFGTVPSMMNAPSYLRFGCREDGYPMRADLFEALVYAGPVSDPDLTLIRDYLSAKHGL